MIHFLIIAFLLNSRSALQSAPRCKHRAARQAPIQAARAGGARWFVTHSACCCSKYPGCRR